MVVGVGVGVGVGCVGGCVGGCGVVGGVVGGCGVVVVGVVSVDGTVVVVPGPSVVVFDLSATAFAACRQTPIKYTAARARVTFALDFASSALLAMSADTRHVAAPSSSLLVVRSHGGDSVAVDPVVAALFQNLTANLLSCDTVSSLLGV